MLAVHRPVVNGVMTSEMLCLVGIPAWRDSRLLSVVVITSRILVLVSVITTAFRRIECNVPVVTFQKIRHQPKIIFQTADGGDQSGHQTTAKPQERHHHFLWSTSRFPHDAGQATQVTPLYGDTGAFHASRAPAHWDCQRQEC